MNDDILTEPFLLAEDDDELGCWMAAEVPLTRDLNTLLEDLHGAVGSGFVWTWKKKTSHGEFKPLDGENNIFVVGGETAEDYSNLLNAARKAVEYGYRVFVLPNPKGIRTADFIFERKGVYKLFDLKTITGKASVSNRLLESIGQTNRVLLNMTVDYNPMALARNIKSYFEHNANACEVMIFKGNKQISITRKSIDDRKFYKTFIRRYTK